MADNSNVKSTTKSTTKTAAKAATKTTAKTTAKTAAKTSPDTSPKVKSRKRKVSEIVAKLESVKAPGFGNPEYRMLAKDFFVSNNTHATKLNNNDIIIGSSGRGKTTGYVSPLIEQKCGSMLITDTKNDLYDRHAKDLKKAGYRVLKLDMMGRPDSCSYNPLDFVGYDPKTDTYSDKDITSIAEMLCPVGLEEKDPFWPSSAQIFITALISYLLESTPKEEHNFKNLIKLYKSCLDSKTAEMLFAELEAENPDSFAVTRYHMFKSVTGAERTYACIMMFVATAFMGFDCADTDHVFNRKSSFKFEDFGKEKTAVFLNVSDTDRSQDRLVNIFYSQALDNLIKYADSLPGKKLAIPVRLVLDDFATNTVIPNFSKLISIIRSREISVSIILQSISQLNEIYTQFESNTVISNCDHMLFLGTSDVETAKYIGEKMNKPYYNILNMPIDTAFIFESGNPRGGMEVEKYRPDYFDKCI